MLDKLIAMLEAESDKLALKNKELLYKFFLKETGNQLMDEDWHKKLIELDVSRT